MNTENTQVGSTPLPEQVVSGVDSTPKKLEDNKKFTQEDVNAIVSGRLAKEREKFADYDTIKSQVSELQEYKNKYTELEQKALINEQTLNEVYQGMIESLDDDKKNLIPEQLNLVDKIKYLNKNKNILQVKPIISTPAPEDKNKGEAGLYGGKYKTLQEWAIGDPKGYMAWRKSS